MFKVEHLSLYGSRIVVATLVFFAFTYTLARRAMNLVLLPILRVSLFIGIVGEKVLFTPRGVVWERCTIARRCDLMRISG